MDSLFNYEFNQVLIHKNYCKPLILLSKLPYLLLYITYIYIKVCKFTLDLKNIGHLVEKPSLSKIHIYDATIIKRHLSSKKLAHLLRTPKTLVTPWYHYIFPVQKSCAKTNCPVILAQKRTILDKTPPVCLTSLVNLCKKYICPVERSYTFVHLILKRC